MLVVVVFTSLLVSFIALVRAYHDHQNKCRTIEALQKEIAAARRRLDHQGKLASEIAHDIKNPLTAILCSAEALDLLIGGSLEEIHRNSLRYIKEYGGSLLQLMTDFLDVHRAEAGQIKSKPSNVAVLPVIQSVVGLLESSAAKKHIALTCSQSRHEHVAYVDLKQFKQVIFNLLHNAIKFTDEHGTVSVDIQPDYDGQNLHISVADTGIGIDSKLLPFVFDPYARYEGNVPDYDVGVGLGLALCRSLVDLAGGSIGVSSKLGEGSVFVVSLPLFVGESSSKVPRRSSELSDNFTIRPLAGQCYLIVDRDKAAREAVSCLIAAWGGLVDQVSAAADAVEALSKHNYSAVMIDSTAGEASIGELKRIIKDDLKEETKIIVAVKDQPDPTIVNTGDAVIEKPFNGEKLLKSLLN